MEGLIGIGSWLAAGATEHGEKAHEGGHHGLSMLGLMVYIGLVVLIIVLFAFAARKEFGQRFFTRPAAQMSEQLFLFMENMTVGIIGEHGRKYVPMMMTFWMVIFVSNLVSLVFPTAPTADLSFNLAMALIAIGYVQYEGIRSNGFFGHFGHFAGPKLPGAMVIISAMIFVIELISEVMKNVSLSLRLYGNIHGGHEAVVAMNNLGKDIFIPFGAFLMPIKLLTCVVQALIFTLLTCVYLSLVTHHDHGDEHGHDEHAPAPAH